MPKKIITKLQLNELSNVDRPAQRPALALIVKRVGGQVEQQPNEETLMPESKTGTIEKADFEKEVSKLKSEIKKFSSEKESLQAELAKAQAQASFTDADKAAYAQMSESEKADFEKLDAKERKQLIAKRAASDEALIIDGKEIRKSVVGEDSFAVFTAMQKRLDLSEQIAKKERDERLMTQMTKRAEDTYPNIPGKPEEKGKMLMGIEKLGADEKELVEKALTVANAAIAKTFKSEGHGEDALVTTDKLDQMAKSYAEEHNVSYHQAYDKIMDTPEAQRIYADSLTH
jgi:vacuolar-type H+-ATPase subunit I/STV1